MFLGEYKHTIDNKCRLTIPAKFREDLNNQCVIAKGLDGCLAVYPMDEWALICEKIDAKPSSDVKVRRLSAFSMLVPVLRSWINRDVCPFLRR